MNARRLLSLALMMALILTAVVAMTASAAPASQGKIQVAPEARQLKFLGEHNFAPSPKLPSHHSGPATDLKGNVNRAIPGKTSSGALAPRQPTIPTVPPDTVATGTPGVTRAIKGLNAFDTWQVNDAVFQPPDQGLCAGNGFALEMVNDVAAVYDSRLTKISGDMSLDAFFNTAAFGLGAVGDPKCYFDPAEKRFIATQIGQGGAEGNVSVSYFVMIAVSATEDPRLGWYLYALDATFDCPADAAPCLPDQPLIGANRDAFFISTNDFEALGTRFFGANIYAIDKTHLVVGSLPSLINVALFPVGSIPAPDGTCDPTTGINCWYSVQPAFSGKTMDWDNRQGGIEYFLSALEFTGQGDNRIEEWAFTNTKSIHAAPGNSNFGLSMETIKSQPYIVAQDFSAQKDDGLIPFGKVYFSATAAGPIQPNDDRMNQVFFGDGVLWSGLNTGLMQKLATPEYHNGIAYFGLKPTWSGTPLTLGHTWVQKGYIAPRKEDVVFPSIAFSSPASGAMVFTLTSPNRYPSSAYVLLGPTTKSDVYVSNAGRSSYDGSCEYNPACGNSFGKGLRPRWGDYTSAVVMGGQVYIATEYIQDKDCDVTQYQAEGAFPTCGDTRSWRQNWGTSIVTVRP